MTDLASNPGETKIHASAEGAESGATTAPPKGTRRPRGSLPKPAEAKPAPTTAALSALKVLATVQPRAGLSEATVKAYAELMRGGVVFPPLDVFGDARIVADGFHRLEAAKRAGLTEIGVKVHQGGERDARLFAFSANREHGLPLSAKDRKRAAQRMLADAEWAKWSDREIARHCGVSPTTIGELRKQVSNLDTSSKRKGKDGKSYSTKSKRKSTGERAEQDAAKGIAQLLNGLTARHGRARLPLLWQCASHWYANLQGLIEKRAEVGAPIDAAEVAP